MKLKLQLCKVDGRDKYDYWTTTFNGDFKKVKSGIISGVEEKAGIDLNAIRRKNAKFKR